MMRPFLCTALLFAIGLATHALASTRGIVFIHQPITTLGTEQDAEIIIARFPALSNAVPENFFTLIAASNRLVQDHQGEVADSNILSSLKIQLAAEHLQGSHYRITIDLQKAGDPGAHGVTLDHILSATIECLQKTCTENKLGTFEVNILRPPGDQTDWSKYEKKYVPKKEP